MNPSEDHQPEYDSFQKLFLDLAQERSVGAILWMIVDRLAQLHPVALARLWLMDQGDICTSCFMRQQCSDRTKCLHLMASSGRSLKSIKEDWSQVDGHFRRFPLGVHMVGRIAKLEESGCTQNRFEDSPWLMRRQWVRRENIRGFCGQPLIYQGEVLGVLAVFLRASPHREWVVWLRMLADHAAIAISNARAFGEIEDLKVRLELENAYLREEINQVEVFGDIVGQSDALKVVLRQIDLVAPTDASVMIQGESGTGKELVAREIYKRSRRCKQPLIKVNCASVPRELYESEFFGHIKGAFTGAVRDRAGRFEAANQGTLFLDEVAEIPLELQSKLLRVLQEGTYERVGEDITRRADVRIIASTNRDLEHEVAAGRFRQDLYYRLNVFPIQIAPLRLRKEDIPALAQHFLTVACKKMGKPLPRLTMGNLLRLQTYDWPGNVRELRNVIERALITSGSESLQFDLSLINANSESLRQETVAETSGGEPEILTEEQLKKIQKDNLRAALRKCEGKIYGTGGAAELLGLKPTTLCARIKKLGLVKYS
jgi:transcriptional regulator with GAF, ATPase, and Fis domain